MASIGITSPLSAQGIKLEMDFNKLNVRNSISRLNNSRIHFGALNPNIELKSMMLKRVPLNQSSHCIATGKVY